jgi:hypothetical protein
VCFAGQTAVLPFTSESSDWDREDARLLLRLMRENSFPQIWVPGPENRDLRQLLWHRHRLVQMRTRITRFQRGKQIGAWRHPGPATRQLKPLSLRSCHDATGELASLEAFEYIDKFVYTLKLRAGSRLGLPARARPKETVSKARYLVEVIERKLAAASDATGKQK